jgi:hypothetical protein
MISFTSKHFFGPDGQVILVPRKTAIHMDYVYDNPQLFGFRNRGHVESIHQIGGGAWNPIMKRGFIRGEYGFDGKTHIHNLTYEGDRGATPIKFKKALETLHQHYSNHPKRKFSIGVFAYDGDEDNRLNDRVNKIVGDKPIDDGMHTLKHLEQFIGSIKDKPTAQPVKKIARRDAVPVVNTSRLGREPNMGQGNMTTAEWNFWRRKGLGDSYNPLMSFKQYISENWSYARNNEWKGEDAGKYLFHVTDSKSAKKIIDQGQLVPSNVENIQPHIDSLKRLTRMVRQLGIEPDSLKRDLDILKKRTTNVFFSRDVGDQGKSPSTWMYGGKRRTVLKFPIANIPRNLARRFEVDVPGSEVANRDRKPTNPSAITIKGNFPK